METNKKLTGYPSIDKPWLKYYSQEAVHAQIPEGSIYEQLCECNKDNLSGKALSYFSTTYTYRQLIEKIDRTAQAFQNMGVKAGDIVNVALPNIPENIFIVYGLNKIGAIANLIDLRSKGDILLHYLNETDAKIAVICDLFAENVWEVLEQTSIEKVIVVSPFDSLPAPFRFVMKKRISMPQKAVDWKTFLKYGAHSFAEPIGKSDDIAVILHTSGTTGVSKGVMLTNKCINAMAIQYKMNGMKYETGDVFLNQVPPFLAYNIVLTTNLPLCLSMHLRLLPQYEPEKFAHNILKYKANHVVAGPADWMNFLESKEVKNKSFSFLKTLASGGDCMADDLKKNVNGLLQKHGCKYFVMEGYGMTEVGSAACTNLPQHDVMGSVGVPLPLTTFCIWDNEYECEMAFGQHGEICITGPTMMNGYYNNLEETEKVMKTHADGKTWIHTGDLGYMDTDGNVYIKGRLKRVIVRYDGAKISPFQIEEVICKNEFVKECCVVGKEDNVHGRGKAAVAYIVSKSVCDSQRAVEQIKEMCEHELKEVYQPSDYIVIEKMPLTPNGKVDYRTLENMDYMVTKR